MSPAEQMRLAARLLRERTALIDPGPWAVVPNPPEQFGSLELVQGADWAVARAKVGEGAYIATMHPGVGRAVADWLEVEAAIAARHLPDDSGAIYPALAVAREVLGTTEAKED